MNITNVKNTPPFLSQSSANRDKTSVDFKATLAAVDQNLSQTNKDTTQKKSTGNTKRSASNTGKTAAEELEEYLRKSPAQHMRDAILKEMGLTEADLAAMPPEKRQAIEATITAKIKERLQEQSGVAKNATQRPLSTQALLTDNMA